MPNFKTDEPVCPKDQLQCGNGECINKELFCNDRPDCKDESDENACSKCYRFKLRNRTAIGYCLQNKHPSRYYS